MTITQNVASKLVVGFVAASMLFTLSFSPAKAATSEELQAQITALLAQIAALQAQVGQGAAPAAGACTTFTMDLTMGASGADVTALHNFLIGKGHAIAAGATGYFGGQTQAALMAFQSANGISPAAGYFGPITRAKVNAMCEATPADDDANDDDANDDDANDDEDEELSGEASLDSFEANDGDDTELEEGQEDAPVAEFEVEFADGDAMITRIDVAFVATGAEEDPWDTFDEVSLWVDGDEVARMDASDEDEYLDEDDGSLRFSGLDIVGMEDEPVTIVVGVTVQGSVDDMPADWTVTAEAMRFLDADDVSTTESTFEDLGDVGVDFDIDEAGTEDEIIVKSASDDPDSTTLKVETGEKSDWYTIFAFDLDTDDSINDIEVNELVINVGTPNDLVGSVVSDAQLVIDGETFDDCTIGSSTVAYTTYTCDIDGDLVIDAGDRVTAEFEVEFKALTGNYDEGDTILASTTGVSGDFEGVDDVIGEGSATGDTHTLRSTGVILEPSTMSETLKSNTDTTTADDEGTFVIKFDVTAFEDDVWVVKTAASGTAGFAGGAGADYLVQDSAGNQVNTGTSTGSLTSTADTDGTRFKINEGETETFTLTVNYDPATAGYYQVQLFDLNFAVTNAVPTTSQVALPAADYQTDQLSI